MKKTSKYNRARIYLGEMIDNDGSRGGTHSDPASSRSWACRMRKESDLFTLAEIYAEAAGKAAPIVEESGDVRVENFHISLMAEPFQLVSQWQKEEEGY